MSTFSLQVTSQKTYTAEDLYQAVSRRERLEVLSTLISSLSLEALQSSLDYRGIPLYWAACWDRPDVVQLLLQRKVDPNQHEKLNGTTPLYMAVGRGHLQAVKLLLQAGANPSLPNLLDKEPRGNTPFLRAVWTGNEEILRLFLQVGVNPSMQDECRANALHVALFSDHLSLVDLLLEAGTDPTARSCLGETPGDEAARMFGKEAAVTRHLRQAERDCLVSQIQDRALPLDLAKIVVAYCV